MHKYTKKNRLHIKEFNNKWENQNADEIMYIYKLLESSRLKLNTHKIYHKTDNITKSKTQFQFVIYLYDLPIAHIELDNKFHSLLTQMKIIDYLNNYKFNKIINYFVNISLFKENINKSVNLNTLIADCFDVLKNYLSRNPIYNYNLDKQFVSFICIVDKDNEFGFNAMKYTNFEYLGTDLFEYNREYHIYKLSLNKSGAKIKQTPSINDFNNKYIISRQIIDEGSLDDTQLIANFKTMNLRENLNEFKYYENNAFVYLHNFETHTQYNLPLQQYVPIFMLNSLNYPPGLSSYYILYNEMLVKYPEFTKKHFVKPVLLTKTTPYTSDTMHAYFIDTYKKTTNFYYHMTEETFEIVKTKYAEEMYVLDYYVIEKKNTKSITFNKYNFNIMVYFVISIINGVKKLHIFNTAGLIVYYNKDYDKKYDDVLQNKVFFNSNNIFFYPDDLYNCDSPINIDIVNKNIYEIINNIFELYKNDINLFHNCINGYKVFTIEFSINKDLSLITTFINNITTYCNYFNTKHSEFAKKYFNFINNIIS